MASALGWSVDWLALPFLNSMMEKPSAFTFTIVLPQRCAVRNRAPVPITSLVSISKTVTTLSPVVVVVVVAVHATIEINPPSCFHPASEPIGQASSTTVRARTVRFVISCWALATTWSHTHTGRARPQVGTSPRYRNTVQERLGNVNAKNGDDDDDDDEAHHPRVS